MFKLPLKSLISIGFVFSFLSSQIHESRVPLTPDCSECHKCEKGEYPTKENPCLVQCPGTKTIHDFSTLKQSEKQMEVILIDMLTEQYGPVIFAHEYHASMSRMSGGCENCHHYSDDLSKIQSCVECHPKQSSLTSIEKPSLKGAYHRQCLNCHREWAHENACEFCHKQITEQTAITQTDKTDIIGIPHPLIAAEEKYVYQTNYEKGTVVTFHHEEHVDLFGLQCVACHKGDSCCRCHEAGHEHKKIEHTTTCCSCHQEENNCKFCHNDKEQPPFNHAVSTGWELNKYHINNACQDCHGPAKSFVKPSTVCVNCHIHWEEGSFNHKVTGLILSEDHEDNECGDCHIDMDFVQDPSCSECHDEISYPEAIPGKFIKKRNRK